jgi:hypothetical protein
MNHHALHTGRLVLTPVSPYAALEDQAPLVAMLREIALIDSAILPHTNRFLLGENFMQWINFMGCSPFIRMEPGEDNEPYCHLIIDGPTSHPRLLAGRNTTPPRCANCRKRLIDWRHTFAAWEEASPGWLATCPHCGQTQDPVTYDFRQTAGCGRLFLFIENIFPQEAIPSPSLLQYLKKASDNLTWGFFYQQE